MLQELNINQMGQIIGGEKCYAYGYVCVSRSNPSITFNPGPSFDTGVKIELKTDKFAQDTNNFAKANKEYNLSRKLDNGYYSDKQRGMSSK